MFGPRLESIHTQTVTINKCYLILHQAYGHYGTQRHEPQKKSPKHTTGGIPRWSPTLVLVARFSAYVWQSGRDAQFSLTYGRM